MAGEAFAQEARPAAGAPGGADGNGQSVFAETGGQDEIAIRPAGIGGGTEDFLFAAEFDDATVQCRIVGEGKNEEGSINIFGTKSPLDEMGSGNCSNGLFDTRGDDG